MTCPKTTCTGYNKDGPTGQCFGCFNFNKYAERGPDEAAGQGELF